MKTPAIRFPVAIAAIAGVLGIGLHLLIFAFIRIENLGTTPRTGSPSALVIQEDERFDWSPVDPANLFLPMKPPRGRPVVEFGLPVAEFFPPFDLAPDQDQLLASAEWMTTRERANPPVAFLLQEDRNEFARFGLRDRPSVVAPPALYPEIISLDSGISYASPPVYLPAEILSAGAESSLSPATFLLHLGNPLLQTTPFLVASSSLPNLDDWLARQLIDTNITLPPEPGYYRITFHP